MVVGLLRPRILLPEQELSPEQWEGVLTHELVHWRRHDLWIKWLAVLARAVHWFNPAVWWLVCRLEQDCELSCDEQTVRRWDSPRRARYGELLLILAAGGDSGFGGVSLSLSSPKQRLKERLICMMTQKRYGRPAARWRRPPVWLWSCPPQRWGPTPGLPTRQLPLQRRPRRPCPGPWKRTAP